MFNKKPKQQQKFTFKIDGLRSTLINGHFKEGGVTVQLWATSYREADEKIEDYFAKGYLRCEKVTLEKIEI